MVSGRYLVSSYKVFSVPYVVSLQILLFFALFLFFAGNSFTQSLDTLENQIRSGSIEQKRDALFQIRNLRSESASRLALPALKDNSEIVRATAASSIIFLPKNEAVAFLIPLLNEKAPFVRREAAFALGEVADPSSSLALINTIEKDRDEEVRSAAVVAIGKTGGTASIDKLSEILTKKPSEDDEFLRRAAARSIGQIAQIIRSGITKVVTPASFLSEKYKESELRPLEAVEKFRFQSALLVLIRVLQDKKEADDTRREAAFALGSIGDISAIPALKANLDSKDNFLAEICREALQKIQPSE